MSKYDNLGDEELLEKQIQLQDEDAVEEVQTRRAILNSVETTSLIHQMLIRNRLPRVNPEEGMHRHVGYDEPHPVDQTHWGEEETETDMSGPFSVEQFLGTRPANLIKGYTNQHDHYFKLLQNYLDIANPDVAVSDNRLNVIAKNLRPRIMKCAEDVRRKYLSYDREIRDLHQMNSIEGVDKLEGNRQDAGNVYRYLDDASEYFDNPEERTAVVLGIDKLFSLEKTQPRSFYLAELFGIPDGEEVRRVTLQVLDRMNRVDKIDLGFVGAHYLDTGEYLKKAEMLVSDAELFKGIKDRPIFIEKALRRKTVIAGYASPVVKDKEGHRIPLYALRKAFEQFMTNPEYRNVMVKHKNAQVGRVVPEYTDSFGREWKSQVDDVGLFVVIELRDDIKIARDVADLIHRGIFRSFSIGGEALSRKYVCQVDQCWWDVTGLELHEITICEEGKNQAAKFILLKSEDIEADIDSLNLTDLVSAL
jgi:HK97 family phage prohead protease